MGLTNFVAILLLKILYNLAFMKDFLNANNSWKILKNIQRNLTFIFDVLSELHIRFASFLSFPPFWIDHSPASVFFLPYPFFNLNALTRYLFKNVDTSYMFFDDNWVIISYLSIKLLYFTPKPKKFIFRTFFLLPFLTG